MTSRKAVAFPAHIKANSSRSELVVDGRTIRIFVRSPPVEGRANAEAIRVVAKTLRVPLASVELLRGRRSRTKHFRVSEVEAVPKALESLFERVK